MERQIQKAFQENAWNITKHIEVGDNIHFENYTNGKEGWEDSYVIKSSNQGKLWQPGSE